MKKLVALLLVAMLFISGTALADFPLTEKPVTLKFLSRTPAYYPGQDFAQVENMIAYEAMTGVHVEFDNYDPNVFSNTLAGAIASGDLPDVIFRANISNTQMYEWGDQGFLVDLTPYLEEYAPNFTALMEKYPDIRLSITAPDGAIYGFPQAVIAPEMRLPSKMFINKKGLEAAGMTETPTTLDELYNLLVAIRDGDQNGNGIADEIPLVGKPETLYKIVGGAFNLANRGNHSYVVDVDPETKQPRIWGISDDAREMLVYLRKLYSEKLIDQEIFTNGTNNAGALAATDSLGVVLHTTASMISNEKIGDYVGLKSALIGPDGTGYVVDARSNLHSVGNYCVTTACENIEVAVAWVDYFYSEEGARFMLVGQEGKDWEIKADGKGYWTDETAARRTPDMSQDAFIALFSMWPGGRVPAAFNAGLWGGEYSDEPAATAQSMINYLTDNVWPIFSWTEEENEVVSTTESDIKKFINNYFALVIAGETELNDKTWNDFVANVNRMGADKLLDAYKSALERIYGGSAY